MPASQTYVSTPLSLKPLVPQQSSGCAAFIPGTVPVTTNTVPGMTTMNNASPVRFKNNHISSSPNGPMNHRPKNNARVTNVTRGHNGHNARGATKATHHGAPCYTSHNENHIRTAVQYHSSLPVSYISQSYPMNSYATNQAHAVYQSASSLSSSHGDINQFTPYHTHQNQHHHTHLPMNLPTAHHNYHQHHVSHSHQHPATQQQQQQPPVYALAVYPTATPLSTANSRRNASSGTNSHHKPASIPNGPGRPMTALDKIHHNQKSLIQLHELTNHVCVLAVDSLGSRFLQERLLSASTEEKILIFKEILSSLYQMVTNPFANYVVQKYFAFGTPEQKHILVQHIKGQVVNLITHAKATHVIQKAIESVTLNDQKVILSELSGQVVRCSRDGNACHTLQRIIDICSTEITSEIVDDMIANTEILAEDQYGNYCIQELLEKGSPPCKKKISKKLLSSILPLARHKIANNVIQKCIKLGDSEILSDVLDSLKGHVVSLATHPYGSRVIQSVIQQFCPNKCTPIIEEAFQQIENLAQDSYGNFVLHQILEHGKLEDKTKLVETICEKAFLLSRHRYANILVQKCIRQMSNEQMRLMVDKVKGQTSSLATHPHGCRVLQSLLECGEEASIHTIIFEEINQHIDDLIQDEHSNYVVQQMLDQGTPEDRSLVVDKVCKNFIPLAQNKFSTNVVQKCLHIMDQAELEVIVESISGHIFELVSHPYSVHVIQILFAVANDVTRSKIFDETLQENFLVSICQDQYGNYSVQHMIEHGSAEQRKNILQRVTQKLLQLSSHKFASNVISKALNYAEKAQKDEFIQQACTQIVTASKGSPSKPGTSSHKDHTKDVVMIVAMSEDPYANYVVQKMIDVSDEESLNLIRDALTPFYTRLCKIPYSKGILSKLPSSNSLP